jgi:putative pyruvate formate lyase activating enzyme
MAAYLELFNKRKLADRVKAAKELLQRCHLCPRNCGIDRSIGEKGTCRTGHLAIISSYGPHFGEEPPLVGKTGSGTIFFTNCNLQCLFCQNYSISQLGNGFEISKEDLARIMLSLQNSGCTNINLVSPTHVVPQILEGLEIAIELGLNLPLVYNSSGYDRIEVLKILDGIIDIYMPDMKYSNDEIARDLSGIEDYSSINRSAVKEMHRQVGNLQLDCEHIATQGLLIRHLVLPHRLAGTRRTVEFISRDISPDSYVNIMDQYRPCYKAFQWQQLSSPLSSREFSEAIELASESGLTIFEKNRQSIGKPIG